MLQISQSISPEEALQPMEIQQVIQVYQQLIYGIALTDTTPLPVLFDLPEDNQLFAALCSLKPMYRNVLYLYYFAGYRTEEIAGLLGKRAGTIRMQLLRGREQLRTQLQDEEGTVDG